MSKRIICLRDIAIKVAKLTKNVSQLPIYICEIAAIVQLDFTNNVRDNWIRRN